MAKREFERKQANTLVGKYIMVNGGRSHYITMGKVVEGTNKIIALKPYFTRDKDHYNGSQYTSHSIYFNSADNGSYNCKILTKEEFDKVYNLYMQMCENQTKLNNETINLYYD